jgi:Tfp pilus assembly protein PilN
MIEINLLPGAQRKTGGREFAPGAALAGLGERFKDKYLILGTLGLAIGIVAMAGMWTYQSRQEQALEARQSAASADSARFAAVLKARSRAEAERDSVYQQLAIIKSIDDSRFVWPHILEEINLALPQYTWLTDVAQTSAVTSGAAPAGGDTTAAGKARADSAKKLAKGDRKASAAAARARADSLYNGASNTLTFRITGQTVDLQALTLFMKNLEASPYIRNVQLTRSDLVTAANNQVTEFQLEAQSEVPPPDVVRTVPLSIAVH